MWEILVYFIEQKIKRFFIDLHVINEQGDLFKKYKANWEKYLPKNSILEIFWKVLLFFQEALMVSSKVLWFARQGMHIILASFALPESFQNNYLVQFLLVLVRIVTGWFLIFPGLLTSSRRWSSL